jgi:hypothetical protein
MGYNYLKVKSIQVYHIKNLGQISLTLTRITHIVLNHLYKNENF